MSVYPDPDGLDDLFGPAEPNDPASQHTGLFLPMLAPPMPALPPSSASNSSAAQEARTTRNDSTPEFTEEERRQLWKIIKAQSKAHGSLDAQRAVQNFVSTLAVPSVPQPVVQQPTYTAGVSATQGLRAAIHTQLESKANPPPPGAKISHARDKSTENRIGQYDWYDQFPARANWMAQVGDRQVPIKYSKLGELKPTIKFDKDILEAYIQGCATHGIPLRLWIQNSATMHTDRFPSRASHLCRSINCPVRNSTIARGMYQVCLDEYPTETSNGRFDPFFVAGYFHLFCLEELVPLAELMMIADVQPDVRSLPLEQRNPMSLNRDGAGRSLESAYHDWKNTHFDRYVHQGLSVPKMQRKSSQCLYKFLTVRKMEAQPQTRQKMRDQRNGFDISKHHGNLWKLATHKADSRRKRKLARFESDSSADMGAQAAYTLQEPVRKRARAVGASDSFTPSPLRRSRRLSGALADQCNSYTAPHVNYTQPMTQCAEQTDYAADSLGLVFDGVDFSTLDLNQATLLFGDAYSKHAQQQGPVYALQNTTHAQQDVPYGQQEPEYGQQETPYAQQETPYAQQETPFAQQETMYAKKEPAYAEQQPIYTQQGPTQQNWGLNRPLETPLSLIDPALLQHDANSRRLSSIRTSGNAASLQDDTLQAMMSPTRRVTRSMSRHAWTILAEHAQHEQLERQVVPETDASDANTNAHAAGSRGMAVLLYDTPTGECDYSQFIGASGEYDPPEGFFDL